MVGWQLISGLINSISHNWPTLFVRPACRGIPKFSLSSLSSLSIVQKVILFHYVPFPTEFPIFVRTGYLFEFMEKKCALLLQNISKSLHRGKWCSADHLISPSAKLFGRPLYFFNSISWIWSKYLSKVIKSISPSDQLDAPTCLAITHLISWSAPREQHLIVQEWHMLISPYICPPVLLVYNQSYSRRVKKFCIFSDVHPLGHSPKLHCIDSMKELIACLKTVHANIHIYYAQKLFS